MADQRRRECDRHRAGRDGWTRRLGSLVAALILVGACGGEVGTAPAGGLPLGGAGGGAGSSGGTTGTLVGTWQTVVLTELPSDVHRTTTTWRFDLPGDCRRTIETFSLAEGIARFDPHDCRWLVDGSDLVITFAGDSASVRFRFGFQGFSPRKLLLDGFLFDRIA